MATIEIGPEIPFMTVPILTTVQRDALIPINGMLIYNKTLNKFQGFENGIWVNLI